MCEFRRQARCLPNELLDVVCFLKRNAVGSEPSFHSFFRRLLTVVDSRVERAASGIGRDARGLQVMQRLGQPLASKLGRASSIEFAPALQNVVLNGRAQVTVAVELGASLDEHIFAHVQIAETVMRPLHPPNGFLAAVADNDHQIHVAVLMWRARSVRAKEINFLRLELGFQPFHDLLQQT